MELSGYIANARYDQNWIYAMERVLKILDANCNHWWSVSVNSDVPRDIQQMAEEQAQRLDYQMHKIKQALIVMKQMQRRQSEAG